jgi:hypothetical protein
MTPGRYWTAALLLAAFVQEPDPHAHHRSAPTPTAGGWVRYQHPSAGFSLEHPANWSVVGGKNSVSTHIAHPTKAVHLFASAFSMPAGGLQDFAEVKFAVQQELFKPLASPRPLNGEGWSGLVQEAEAKEGVEQARRRILCAQHGTLYVSLALYVDPKELDAPDTDYDRLFTSLRFAPATPSPPPPQSR